MPKNTFYKVEIHLADVTLVHGMVGHIKTAVVSPILSENDIYVKRTFWRTSRMILTKAGKYVIMHSS